MTTRPVEKNQVLEFTITAAFFLLAVWLLIPFVKIGPEDYARADQNFYRLAVGILILLGILGKLSFDVFFPQGIAQKVSSLKTVALLIYSLFILGFILYIIVQAAALYLKASSETNGLPF